MSESVYRQMVAQLAASGHSQRRPKSQIREEIVHYVEVAFAAGEHWAKEVLLRWQLEGAERDYEQAHKSMNTTTYIRKDGMRVRKTVSYSQPKRSAETGAVEEWVQGAFWEYTLPEMLNKRNELDAQDKRLVEIVAAFDVVIAAMKRHTECKTAREAWLADGHDLAEIQLAA